ncbi:hypothetical protein NQ317_008342 [Molorchus minor]|uniref:Serine/threonine-protein kinase 11-interacting protein PH domain-containing protein n=1 Tax=Molorchus minor TaxID=1323400 RepID=A0ABQ9IXT8_9CUCU|nr:hypothetical protein NQ317_008342 [Molorchus minor]
MIQYTKQNDTDRETFKKRVLVLKNNFIEGLQGLTSLSNIVQLDLGHNCLLDHKVLLAISHFPSLQWLNLQGNPISFHPHHRNVTCNYLNKNSSTLKFVLDDILLNKREKSLTGSLYPLFQTTIPAGSSHNSLDDSVNGSIQEKTRRIRHVIIEDYSTTKEDKTPALTPPTSSQHLEIKRQVEQLREEYGESWLYRHSGMLVQDVLGLQKTGVLSSTPYESAMGSFSLPSHIQEELISSNINFETIKDESSAELKEDKFTTANDESGIFNNSMVDDLSDVSDGDDICEGEKTTNTADNDQVFVVLTKTHISERDVTTSKERARWHFNTVRRFEMVEDNQNAIKIDFDTLRRDRKQRIYDLDPEESESFQRFLQMKIKNTQKPAQKKVTYQCMKCSELFPEQNKNALLDQPSVTCPRCKSNLVIESM